jgi:hypothetical protein
MSSMDGGLPAARWRKAYWRDEDVWFFLEVSSDGWVDRQVELRGPNAVPTVAAALTEWPDADREGVDAVRSYQAKYGALADQPLAECDQFE